MTKQEELEHINRLLETKIASDESMMVKRCENGSSLAMPMNTSPFPRNRIEDEFTQILQTKKQSLVIVPTEFFSFAETAAMPPASYSPMCNCGGMRLRVDHLQRSEKTYEST